VLVVTFVLFALSVLLGWIAISLEGLSQQVARAG
jgi:hypothetical protein